MFYHDPYWNNWSRILRLESDGTVVELDLTPVNCHLGACNEGWDNIAKANIRRHGTALKNANIVDQLPESWAEAIANNTSEETANFLLNTKEEDIVDNIDWKKYYELGKGGGGVSFYDCKKQ